MESPKKKNMLYNYIYTAMFRLGTVRSLDVQLLHCQICESRILCQGLEHWAIVIVTHFESF